MPAPKGSRPRGPKKARWSAARKAEAKRGRPARPERGGQKPPRSERSPRAGRPGREERPDRGSARPRPEGSRGSSSTSRPDRDGRAVRDGGKRTGPGARDSRPGGPQRPERSGRPERSSRPERDRPGRPSRSAGRSAGGARADEAPTRRPARTSPPERAARPDRPERGRHGRVADPARRDRHEGRHTDRFGDRDPAAADSWTAYRASGAAAPVTDDNGFAALGLPARLVERLARDGITEPFPIQAATIPDALAGRDVLGRGQTGSGKTLAFGLPTLARIAESGRRAEARRPLALVLVPTRELAMQVNDALEPLVHVLGLRLRLVAGGLSYEPQISALARGVELLIATPGRLTDLAERGAVDLGGVETAILDEADHMADLGFLPEVSAILDLIPPGGQRLLFSATLDKGVDTLVERYLVDAVTHSTDEATASVTTMDHRVLLIDPPDKKALTAELTHRRGRSIVFVRTQLGADRVARELRERGVLAASLHGGLSQSRPQPGARRVPGRPGPRPRRDRRRGPRHPRRRCRPRPPGRPAARPQGLPPPGGSHRASGGAGHRRPARPAAPAADGRAVARGGRCADASTRVRPGDDTIGRLGGGEPPGTPVPDEVWRPLLEGRPGRGQGRGGGRRRGPGGPRGRGRPPRRSEAGRMAE